MRLPILDPLQSNNFKHFIEYWSKLYYYELEDLYNKHILCSNYKTVDIEQLYKWKNGMNLSKDKKKSLEHKILSKLDVIKRMKESDSVDLNEFLEIFKNVSVVWKIFLLHIIKPTKYPIYDQHIHRAYNYINGIDYQNISPSITNKAKEEFYFNTYLKFIAEYKEFELKKLDEALFTFGKFLQTERYSEIIVFNSKN